MKKGYKLLILKALSFFIENPYEEIHLREFSRKTKISLNSAQRFLSLFLEKGLIKEERKANLRYFKANLDNIVFKHIKITYSINTLQNSGLVEELSKNFHSVILFGSTAKGIDERKSDIDLVCIGDKKTFDLRMYEQILGKEINAHFFSIPEWKKQKQNNKAFYIDIISTGINLIGNMPIVD